MKKIFLMPSNQTANVGCYKAYNLNECLYCESVANAIKQALENAYDCVVEIANRSIRREIEADRAVEQGFEVIFALHTNAAGSSAKGTEVWVRPDKDTQSVVFANKVLNKMVELGCARRSVKYGNMVEYGGNKLPACLVELDFHTNPDRTKWLVENVDVIGNALANVLVDTFGIEPKKKEEETKDEAEESITIEIPEPPINYKEFILTFDEESAERISASLEAIGIKLHIKER